MIAALIRIGLVTMGAGLLGFSVSRQLAGGRSGREVARDWLAGLACIAVGVARGLEGDLGFGVLSLGLALLVGALIVAGRHGVRREPDGR